MSVFDGLFLYEIAMLVGGCLLFLVLLAGLVMRLAKNQSTAGLYLFFALAIVMIGFPSYTEIKISNDGVDLEKTTRDLQANPTDRQLRATLVAGAARLASRPIQNAAILTSIARAQIALGNNQAAQRNVEKVLQSSPKDSAALAVKDRLELDKNLVTLSTAVEQHPEDAAAKGNLARVVADAGKTQIASPVTITNLANAHALLGNQAEARQSLARALQIDPKSPQALQLRDRLGPA